MAKAKLASLQRAFNAGWGLSVEGHNAETDGREPGGDWVTYRDRVCNRIARAKKLSPGQNEGESAADYIRRIANNFGTERGAILDDLPTLAACVEYHGLWDVYDTDFLEGILESIADGDDPEPLRAFIRKWKLPWRIPRETMRAHRESLQAHAVVAARAREAKA